MKALIPLFAGTLLARGVVGRPHDFKRAIVTEVTFVTVSSDVMVYVDQAGVPWSTTTLTSVTSVGNDKSTAVGQSTASTLTSIATVPTPTPAEPVPVAPSVAPPAAPAPSKEADPSPPPQVPVAPSPPSSAPASMPSAEPQGSDGSFPLGVTWDPFAPGGCKTEADWDSQWSKMAEQFKLVRIYGMGCDNIPNALQRANKLGLKLMAGAYVPDETVDNFVQVLSQAIKDYNNGNWDIISIVSIGNEQINEHQMTASQAVNSVNNARGQLRDHGYTGPVGVVDTVPAIVGNPSVCDQSDLVLVNVHAYWDPNAKPEDSGSFVQGQVQQVKSACNGKRVVVTESGWPREDGKPNSKASPDAQTAAMKSIRDSFAQDMFLFTAFDTLWRTEEYEKYWGILQ